MLNCIMSRNDKSVTDDIMSEQDDEHVPRNKMQDRPIIRTIKKNIQTAQKRERRSFSDTDVPTLNIAQIIEKLPFAKMLQSTKQSFSASETPIVTRVYEEKFMRQAYRGEESCIMGEECECMFIDEKHKFVGTQFVLPSLEESENCGLCVLCLRKITQLLYYKVVNEGLTPNIRIQRYGNICGEANEYHPSVVLICPSNMNKNIMPLPIVAHQRNRYSVHDNGGICVLKQHRVYQEDF